MLTITSFTDKSDHWKSVEGLIKNISSLPEFSVSRPPSCVAACHKVDKARISSIPTPINQTGPSSLRIRINSRLLHPIMMPNNKQSISFFASSKQHDSQHTPHTHKLKRSTYPFNILRSSRFRFTLTLRRRLLLHILIPDRLMLKLHINNIEQHSVSRPAHTRTHTHFACSQSAVQPAHGQYVQQSAQTSTQAQQSHNKNAPPPRTAPNSHAMQTNAQVTSHRLFL